MGWEPSSLGILTVSVTGGTIRCMREREGGTLAKETSVPLHVSDIAS